MSHDLDALMPHRAPLRLVDAVVHHEGDATTLRVDVGTHDPFVRDGVVPGLVLVEWMAQAAAAHAGLAAHGEPTAPGYLASVRGFDVDVDHLPVGTTALVRVVQQAGGDGALAGFAGSVRVDDHEVARARLYVARAMEET